LRLVDGRRALILAAEVEAVVAEREQVAVRDGARMLELGTPHLERVAVDGGPPRLAASWQTTGEVLAPPKPPGKLRHALLELRPWRLAPPPPPGGEQTVGHALLLLLPLLGLLIAFEITLAFAVAYLVTGRGTRSQVAFLPRTPAVGGVRNRLSVDRLCGRRFRSVTRTSAGRLLRSARRARV
jgi:hypothetical protein